MSSLGDALADGAPGTSLALRASRADLQSTLRQGGRGSSDGGGAVSAVSARHLRTMLDKPPADPGNWFTHGLLAPWVLHTGLGPDQASSGFMTQVIACALQLGGMPVPKGGGASLVDGLAADFDAGLCIGNVADADN